MKKSDYNFLIIIAMPMITFIISILLLGLIEQTLSTLKPAENNTTVPGIQNLPHQPAPTIYPKTERSMPSQNHDKMRTSGKITEMEGIDTPCRSDWLAQPSVRSHPSLQLSYLGALTVIVQSVLALTAR